MHENNARVTFRAPNDEHAAGTVLCSAVPYSGATQFKCPPVEGLQRQGGRGFTQAH
jgi:hypothetical protein